MNTKKIHITTIPIGDSTIASSRIRCYNLLKNLPDSITYNIVHPLTEHVQLNCDILYIQKIADKNTLYLAETAKSMGIKVIYDIDDDIGVWENQNELTLCTLADLVIVDTENRQAQLKELLKKPIKTLPDSIDYLETNNTTISLNETIKTIATFGNKKSVLATKDVLSQIQKYDLYYIGKKESQLKNLTHIEWAYNTFIQNLITKDICILAHPNDSSSLLKSNNRLIVAMAIGIPTITLESQAYCNTLSELGLQELICHNILDIHHMIEKLNNIDKRRAISKQFKDYAWKHFSQQSISLKFANICKTIL